MARKIGQPLRFYTPYGVTASGTAIQLKHP
jgi:hypothetical protein